ncbi:MAG: hypothetical protein PVG71_12015 [Anaerolineae bacterium]
MFVPEVLIAARAMHAGMNVLRPLPSEGDVLSAGKRLRAPPMPAKGCTLDALVEAGLRENVKVMVAGAPVHQAFADEIGADGYSPDAVSAVELARVLVG